MGKVPARKCLADDGHELVVDEAAEGVAHQPLVVGEELVEGEIVETGKRHGPLITKSVAGPAGRGGASRLALPGASTYTLARAPPRASRSTLALTRDGLRRRRRKPTKKSIVKRVVAHLKAPPSTKGAGAHRRRRAAGPRLQALPRRAVRGRQEGAAAASTPSTMQNADYVLYLLAQSELLSGEPKAAREHFHAADADAVALLRGRPLAHRRLRLGSGRPGGARARATRRCCRRPTTASSRRWRASASARRWQKKGALRGRPAAVAQGLRRRAACTRSPRRRWRSSSRPRRRRSRPRSASRAPGS